MEDFVRKLVHKTLKVKVPFFSKEVSLLILGSNMLLIYKMDEVTEAILNVEVEVIEVLIAKIVEAI